MHGGEVDAFAEAYGIPRECWLDLSTGINPIAFPVPDLAADYWRRLPDSGLDGWLREAAAGYYGVTDPAHVVPTPGSQAAIQWLPRLLPESRVAIIGPTYHEHARSWSEAGHTVIEIETADAMPERADVLLCVNPNNPDGRRHEPEALRAIADGRLLVVDEAFADLTPEISLAGAVGDGDCVVLRSFGKFFGLAGLRLGFVLAGEPLATRIRDGIGPWAVSGPAAAIGAVALADASWARAARVRLTAAAGRLDGLLMRNGLTIAGGTGLFRLATCDRARDLFEHLARAAILVRRFPNRATWLRFGLPADDGGFDQLARALDGWRPKAGAAQTASTQSPAQERRRPGPGDPHPLRRSTFAPGLR